jgi:hypothetical protein
MKPILEIEIRKALYETDQVEVVGVYDRVIEKAIQDKRQAVSIKSPHGEKMFNPSWIKKNCPKIEKVFLRPDEPMKLYKIVIPKKRPMTKEEEFSKMYL